MDQLSAAVQHYDWGDPDFLARLQGRRESGLPEAELWMGAHPVAPATVIDSGVPLPAVVEADPIGSLGEATAQRFGQLPFLAKVLAAARPLSIQAHPSQTQAIEGFAREDGAGIARDARERIYRDANHKPELICALTPFDAKCGFRQLDRTRELFESIGTEALAPLRELISADGSDTDVLRSALAWLLRLEPDAAARLVAAAIEGAAEVAADGPFATDLCWLPEVAHIRPGDVGNVVALLLNHVTLAPGQAVFLPAGNLHAYLRGAGVELMANSDNVIRCGWTSKHVDIDELLDVVHTAPIAPPVQTPAGRIHTYEAPVPEFDLSRIEVVDDTRLRVQGPEILVLTEGMVELTTDGGQVTVAEPGVPVWVPASDLGYVARGAGVLFRATTGTSSR